MSTPTGGDGGQQPPEPDYGAQNYGAQNYGAQSYPGGAEYGAPQQPRNGFGTAALVLGIIGLVLAIIPFTFYVGGVLAILAIIFGVLGRNRAKRGEATNAGMATGGLVTGIIGLIIAIVWTVLAIVGLSLVASNPSVQQLQQCQQQAGSNQAAQQQCGEQFGRSIQQGSGNN